MILEELIIDIKSQIINIVGSIDLDIVGIASDSRKVKADFLFVALKGTASDGKDFINSAIAGGATTIVIDEKLTEYKDGITYLVVKDSAKVLGQLASCWFGHPSLNLTLVGVTGTNGKTTTATLLYELFKKLGYKVGLLSTVCIYVDDEVYPATHTTPDPLMLNGYLAKMVSDGCEYAFMEVSSHAIHQERISGLAFKGGVFTNLTQDHLDYHKTMLEYLRAKKMFFDNLPSTAFALTNLDDKNGLVMLQNTKALKKTYSLKTLADFKARILEKHFDGTTIEFNNKLLEVQFVGVFNVYNLLAVYGTAVLLGEDSDEVLRLLSTLVPVAGRFEIIRSNTGVVAIVDYAHTPDALINVLKAIHEVLAGNGHVISVVGCGGNRDKTKRPIMAREAVNLSDQLILTSDNPRFEEPQEIINDMYIGLDILQQKKTICIQEREQAIKTAYALAKENDIILVAGKGHENYQDIKGVKHHFDDREVIRKIFNN